MRSQKIQNLPPFSHPPPPRPFLKTARWVLCSYTSNTRYMQINLNKIITDFEISKYHQEFGSKIRPVQRFRLQPDTILRTCSRYRGAPNVNMHHNMEDKFFDDYNIPSHTLCFIGKAKKGENWLALVFFHIHLLKVQLIYSKIQEKVIKNIPKKQNYLLHETPILFHSRCES